MTEHQNVNLRVPTELRDALDQAARARCVSRNMLCEFLLIDGLARLVPVDEVLSTDGDDRD